LVPDLELGDEVSQSLSKRMSDMLKHQANLIGVAQATQLANDSHHKSSYTPDFTEFLINSYVLYNNPEGRISKLAVRKQGPYRVINLQGSQYTLQDLVVEKNFDAHISNLSPSLHDQASADPKEVVLKERGKFYVDRIINHRGDKTRCKTMDF
jgi:hypothetical protein